VYFSAEHEEFRVGVRHFLATEILPYADDWERERRIPRSAWKALGQQGLLGLHYPKEVGGGGRDLFSSVTFLEELGRTGYGGLRAAVSVHAYMATYYLATAASAALRAAYLSPAIRGDKVAALAVTEPDAGSDLARLSAIATPHKDHFVLNGEKSMVTNGTSADFYVVLARTSPPAQSAAGRRPGLTGVSLLVVDADLPGVSTRQQETLGWRSAGTAQIRFDNVPVMNERLVGRLNNGFYYLMRGFQLERLVAAVLAVGGMERSIEDTRDHLTSRQIFGARLATKGALRHQFADLITELTAVRQLVYHAAWCYQQGDLPAAECSMAKLAATELACRIADTSLQLHGSHGYLDEAAAARTYRDARAGTIAAGPSEVMRDIVAHMTLDEP